MLELNKIYCGDSLELLKLLPDDEVDCQICSPPFFQLRDYGTATWVGGNSDCDHIEIKYGISEKSKLWAGGDLMKNEQRTACQKQYNKICNKCGAIREDKQFGLEETPEDYVNNLANIFDEVRRVLKPMGTCFIELGDTFLGSGKGAQTGRDGANKESFQFSQKPREQMGGWRKPKQLALIPFRFAIEMQNRGWILRNNLVWYKKNALPQSVKDRWVVDFSTILFFTKSSKYYFNQQIEPFASSSNPKEIYVGGATKNYEESLAQNPSESKKRILESMKRRGGRSQRAVWQINTKPSKNSHTASYSEELPHRMMESGCPLGGTVLDIFNGTGTTCAVAKKLNRNYLGFDLSQEYCNIARQRINEILI